MAGIDILASAFNGANAAFLGDQYARWATDPASVDPSFADLFSAMNDEARSVLEDATGASWAPRSPLGTAAAPPNGHDLPAARAEPAASGPATSDLAAPGMTAPGSAAPGLAAGSLS